MPLLPIDSFLNEPIFTIDASTLAPPSPISLPHSTDHNANRRRPQHADQNAGLQIALPLGCRT
ncbi:unnamed protein product [Lactuca saligna]|uniref:Uncharacterized protein n=1 Tax=Lactuca saligna TaxID=75948 RepID=A0AA36E7K9_LACSI|nr:unnamed protein product [Lactuca saligna]